MVCAFATDVYDIVIAANACCAVMGMHDVVAAGARFNVMVLMISPV